MVSGPLSASKEKLRLWIRLLRASRIIEGELRERLSKEFDTTCRASTSWPRSTARRTAC